jgi:hypothetical protein
MPQRQLQPVLSRSDGFRLERRYTIDRIAQAYPD